MADDNAPDGGEQIPALDDVVDMELEPADGERWIVLYEEDYEDVLFGAGDSVALRVDCNQAVEILQLASSAVAALAPDRAPDREPTDAMIEAIQEVRDGE
jgi:hypothetical protein